MAAARTVYQLALLAVLAVLGVGVAFLLAAGCHCASQPHCPTEDSCRPQYSHGSWSIVQVTP